MTGGSKCDVIVVGGGPAGSAMAWSLARRGIAVTVLERAQFPREKVCGDFVEPAGLRIVEAMGCGEALGLGKRAKIDRMRAYYGPHIAYQERVAYYDGEHGVPPYGHIIPRHELDTALLESAAKAGAKVVHGATVSEVRRDGGQMHVSLRDGKEGQTISAPVVVGADGVQSVVAQHAGLRREDKRHIGISQRLYLDEAAMDEREASIWFDEDHYPGYGWVFPAGGGRANAGLGMLSETVERFDLSLQASFRASIGRLKFRHPDCANSVAGSKPLGGAVHMYGGIRRNHFAGGILVGDAGAFCDPMTAEGITQGMESAIIGSRTIAACLESGRFEEADFAPFEQDFRAYFDFAMRYLCFYATMLRNRHFGPFFLSMTRQGFERAQHDPDFGRVAGAGFGGLSLQPAAIAAMIWSVLARHLAEGGTAALQELVSGRGIPRGAIAQDWDLWQRGWRASVADDPVWHRSWLGDLLRDARATAPSFIPRANPRLAGPFVFGS